MGWWRETPMEDMTPQQWEALCDGCAKCCVIRLEDEDTGDIHATNIGCKLLDGQSCRCTDYPGRQAKVPDCVQLTPANVRELSWLPKTCGYRLIAEGRPLFDWHPLVSGDPES
nr:YcgN family cysteine cluster protein [Hyphomonadaceae bacterium]